ncbi:MAG: adenylosuccinate synthase [Myxococcota bacterium]|jgi:adenylosuccinate synthase
MPAAVIVGAQWGDEGKGKIVDLLSAEAEVVVRFQGGNNAGHTLVVDGQKTVLHLVPSGVLHASATCVIGPGVVIDPAVLASEVALLKGRGLLDNPKRLMISSGASLIMPYHKAIDHAREAARGKQKIGTTGRGIGPAYEDNASRRGIPTRALRNPSDLRARIAAVLPEKNAILAHYGADTFTLDEVVDAARANEDAVLPYIGDVGQLVDGVLSRGGKVLFEGAQGVLLDVLHGTVPYVTSSHTVGAAACTGTGVGPGRINRILGIAKAYLTRVGGGPFPTEIGGELEESIREAGGEYGATTGRPRSCGWLDLAGLRYAIRVGGITELAVTKLDVLSGQPSLQVCVAYRLADGTEVPEMPPYADELVTATPIYRTVPGWSEDLKNVRADADLPATTRAYLDLIASETGVPVTILGVGAERGETLIRRNPFAA